MSDAISAIEADINAWVESEFSTGYPCVPDFWDDLNTSENVAGYLATHGYVAGLLAEVARLRTIEHAARVQHEAYGAYPGLVEALGRSVVSTGTIATLTD